MNTVPIVLLIKGPDIIFAEKNSSSSPNAFPILFVSKESSI